MLFVLEINRHRAFTYLQTYKYPLISGLLPKGLESSFNVTLVTKENEGDAIANNILTNHSRVAIDLEGYNLGRNGLITLCQVAVSSDHVYLFDILDCPYFLSKGKLRRILESKKIQKVNYRTHRIVFHSRKLCSEGHGLICFNMV